MGWVTPTCLPSSRWLTPWASRQRRSGCIGGLGGWTCRRGLGMMFPLKKMVPIRQMLRIAYDFFAKHPNIIYIDNDNLSI
jgi:hypothetical protein